MLLRHIIWMDTEGEMKLLKSHNITIPSWYNTFEHNGHFFTTFLCKISALWHSCSHSDNFVRRRKLFVALIQAWYTCCSKGGFPIRIKNEDSWWEVRHCDRFHREMMRLRPWKQVCKGVVLASNWSFCLVLSSDRMMKTCHSRTSHSQFHQVQNLKNPSQLLR